MAQEQVKRIDIKDVYMAYRKLKNYYFFDNTSLTIRFKIAEFEQQFQANDKSSFEEQFTKAMANVVKIVNGEDEDKSLMRALLDKISFTYTTKSVDKSEHEKGENKEAHIIVNRPLDTSIKVSQLNMLIDAPIEIHVISLLWLMFVGKLYRPILGRNNYAYQFDYDEEKKDLRQGIQLFKPYYIGYKDWRDSALNTASWILDQGKDATILCLDIQRYYYNARITPLKLLSELNDKYHLGIDFENNTIKRLTELVAQINLRYTIVTQSFIDSKYRVSDKDIEEGKSILPVGLLSSAILANLYLCDFDEKIVKGLNPVYYGRYVDDMLFVFSERKINGKGDVVENFMESFTEKKILSKEGLDYKLCDYDKLGIQRSKVALQHFYHDESRASINQFRQNIERQRSEFRYLPDEEDVDMEFDSGAFSLQYSDSIQKLRSLQGFKEDKYGASTFLASKIFMSSMMKEVSDDKKSKERSNKQILNFFKWRTCIDFCTLWEKVATYFFVTNDMPSLKQFIILTCEYIDKIEGPTIIKANLDRYKMDLHEYLMLAVATPWALNLKYEVKGFDTDTTVKCREMAKTLRRANMFRHSLLGKPGINYTSTLFVDEANLYDRATKIASDETILQYVLAPCYIKYDEANLLSIFMWFEKKSDVITPDDICKKTDKLFNRINYCWYNLFDSNQYMPYQSFVNCRLEDRNWYVDVNDSYWKGEVDKRIAIANMKVAESQVEQSMLKKPNLSTMRRDALYAIINEAAKEHCDILILPELSVPHQWLDLLVGQSKKHGMAIIAGLEYYHGKDGYVYNNVATILPFQMAYGMTAFISIRTKNHYSPHESKQLLGYRYRIPKSYLYSMFHWRKVYFSVYNCFELANINDRSLFKSKVDFIVATELNKDVNYYADIAGSWVRDIHCYFIQVNTSHYGDSCVMQPSKSEISRMVSVKGGRNSAILVDKLEINKLRSFQYKEHITQMDDKSFKLTPPDYSREDVLRRIENESFGINGG